MEIKTYLRQIEKLRSPVIAAIDGNCFGGGLELALSCHLRLAGPAAKFAALEINVGGIPSFGGTQRLPRVIGRAKALELMLTGRQVSGEEAVRIGLVNAVYPSNELIYQARTLAGQITEKSYEAVEAVLRATVDGLEMEFDRGMAYESDASSALIGTFNSKEARAAFFGRRKPIFKDK